MRFFHISDLHIGIKLYNRDLYEDQEYVLDQVFDAASLRQPDAVVIAGDIYDKAIPSAESVELFDRFVSGLCERLPGAQIMMISGNHDSAARINLYRDILKRQNVHMIGEPPKEEDEFIEKVTLADSWGDVNFYLLPFVKPSMVRRIVGCDADGNNLSYDETLHRLIERESIDVRERNVLVSHQFYLPAGKDASKVERMDSEICTVGNIDAVCADVLEKFDYAALGHIHKPMYVGSEFYRYAGTPLPCSVSEAGQRKGIIEVEMGRKGDVHTEVIPLEPKHQVKVVTGTLEEVLGKGCDDYVSVILEGGTDPAVFDIQDRLRGAFPNLLTVGSKEDEYGGTSENSFNGQEDFDPFELCCSFLGEVDDAEKELLRDVINSVREADTE